MSGSAGGGSVIVIGTRVARAPWRVAQAALGLVSSVNGGIE
jgi:hypothetical protein